MVAMIATAWNNGSHRSTGAGYGLRLEKADRDAYFSRDRSAVVIRFPNGVHAEVGVDNNSFWSGCVELRSEEIGQWFLAAGLAPWPSGKPPKLLLKNVEANHFVLAAISQ